MMSQPTQTVYHGQVRHTRLRPVRHRLDYSLFYFLLDLDKLEETDKKCRFFKYNRTGLFSFYDKDHGDGTGTSVATWVRQQCQTFLGINPAQIMVLTLPRVLGYVFNPITVYYCLNTKKQLVAVLYEVNNTFGDRHSYLIPVTDVNGRVHQVAEKQMYVSPFNGTRGHYAFKSRQPGKTAFLSILYSDENGPCLTASFKGEGKKLTDKALLKTFLVMPFLTLKVITGIHWHALKLWLKGLRLKPRPKLASSFSVGQEQGKPTARPKKAA